MNLFKILLIFIFIFYRIYLIISIIETKFFNLVLQMNKKETIIFIKVFNKMMNFIIILKMNKNKIYSNQNKIIIN